MKKNEGMMKAEEASRNKMEERMKLGGRGRRRRRGTGGRGRKE